MSQATFEAQETPLRTQCYCDKETCSGEVVVIETEFTKEVYARCAPVLGPELGLDFDGQVRRFYGCLPRILEQGGADMSHVVWERAFFEDSAEDIDSFRQVQKEIYQAAGVAGEDFPATTYLQQPPCRPGQRIEHQIHAIVPKGPESYSVETSYNEETDTIAKLITIDGRRHLYITDINGISNDPDYPGTVREQSDRMFANCKRLLDKYGAKFTDVYRTWCYLVDIDRDYAEFNLSRNAFFEVEGVTLLPASTGIQAIMWPRSALLGMDLYALLDTDGVNIERMYTPTLNEADEYGSAFSRGMKLDFPDKVVLHISGTASVDEYGATVHLDDPYKQIERMLLNVKELLAAQGSSFEDVTQIATFLKRAEYLEMYEAILKEWGIRHVPNTLVETGVCRPELLCELEAIAILPKESANGKAVAAPPFE